MKNFLQQTDAGYEDLSCVDILTLAEEKMKAAFFKTIYPILLFAAMFLLLGFVVNETGDKKNVSNLNSVIESKIDSVLSLMTLEEKVGQLNQLSFGIGWGPTVQSVVPDEYKVMIKESKIGSFLNAVGADFTRDLQRIAVEETRMKIPLLFGYDVIHGFKTTFPVPLAEVSSWDPEVVRMSAMYQALEASSVGIHWTFAPMVDIARDPRWGRIVEGAGEDTYLGTIMSVARVKGLQGDLTSNKNIVACAKHFVGYGDAEGGRDYNTVDMSERTLREVYFPPFKAAVDAGAETFMCSFNEIAGVPLSANKYILTDILRNEWGFNGFVVSDWNSIGEMINHGNAADLKHAGQLSINAGVDMDMESRSYINNMVDLVKSGQVSEAIVNESVRRILRIKFKLGLFDDPYRYCSKSFEEKTVMNEEMQNAALEVSQKSIVLLKNEQDLLPLKKDLKTIAVIGPLAESKSDPLGSWYQQGDSNDVVTVVEGLRTELSNNTKILYSTGCTIDGTSKEGFKDAVEKASQSDVVILVLGEKGSMSGEARSRSSIELPGVQNELAEEIFKTGKPVVVVLMNGRPLSINNISKKADAIVEAWFLGIKSGDAIADVLFGNYNPSGKLPVTFPRSVGQIPIYYNHKNTGRPGDLNNNYSSKYVDLEMTPLYPFGYGLSYTTFSYSDIKLSSQKINKNQKLTISVDVTNNGKTDGEEVVQLYLRDVVASVTRPVKELKGFKKIFLKKGETQTVTFKISNEELKFWNIDMQFVSEPGKFDVFVGTNSVDVKTTSFELIY